MADQYRAGKRLWSKADDRLLRRLYPHQSTAAVATRLRRTVGAVYQRAQILGLAKSDAYLRSPLAGQFRPGSHVGKAHQFLPGHVPANKGLRRPGWGPGRMKAHQFKPGVRQGVAVRLYKPIGAERVSKDGYRERKVNDDLPLQARWRAVHLLVWEAAHGPVPAGHAIVFVNGDKADIRLDNLACIPRADLMRRNSLHRLPPSLVQTIRLLGAVKRQIRRRDHAHDRRSA
jgi:hypothetical protein